MTPAHQSLQGKILSRIILAGLFLLVVTGTLASFFLYQLDDELTRSMKSLAKAVPNAVAPAYMVNNQDVIELLQRELHQNQGIEILCVSEQGLDMLTGEPVESARLERYSEKEPIYYYPGTSIPQEIGMVYFRRTHNFTALYLTALLASSLGVVAILWLLVQRFLNKHVVVPVQASVQAIERYAQDGFNGLDLGGEFPNREFNQLANTIRSMDQTLQQSRESLQAETERNAHERFLQETRRSVVQSSFHDIKNYIQKIDSPSKLIRKKALALDGLSDDQRAFFERQCSVLDSTANWLRENVASARPWLEEGPGASAPVRIEAVDLADLIGPIRAMYETLYEPHGLTLVVEVPVPVEDPLRVLADPLVVRNSVDNLLKNALDHFASQPPPQSPANVTIRIIREGIWVSLIVEDNGSGLPPYVVERFRDGHATESSSGWGVGLMYIAKNIRSIGGEVRYEPNDPTGCRFVLSLKGADYA